MRRKTWLYVPLIFLYCMDVVSGYINVYRSYIRSLERNRVKKDLINLSEQEKYDLQWYVIGEKDEIMINKPVKKTIWNNNYVIWKNRRGEYIALDDACPHKGASLSGGKIKNENVMCPYHGYEYNNEGVLKKVPGLCYRPSSIYDATQYDIVERQGWVFMNTYPKEKYNYKNGSKMLDTTRPVFENNIFTEEDAEKYTDVVYQNMEYDCYSRILSENSLDVMHIGFVHTFGNAKNPSPTFEEPPKKVGENHFKTSYNYVSGEDSLAKRLFGVDKLQIENEFILPHTTIARVHFGDYVSTVVTFATPISNDKSRLYVKTYRNFWKNPLGDIIVKYLMHTTMLQDKGVVEQIDCRYMDGKFNMKYDKLQNTYKTLYKKLVNDR